MWLSCAPPSPGDHPPLPSARGSTGGTTTCLTSHKPSSLPPTGRCLVPSLRQSTGPRRKPPALQLWSCWAVGRCAWRVGGREGVLGGDVAVSMLMPWPCCSQRPGRCAALLPLNWDIPTTHCLPDAARPLPRLGPVSVVELEADKGSQAGSEGFPWRAAWAGAPAKVSAGAGGPSREAVSSKEGREQSL